MTDPTNPALSGGEADRAAQAYIAGRVKAGASGGAIVEELIQRGYDPLTAQNLVNTIAGQHAIAARKSGLISLIAGIAMVVVFTAVTLISYSSAVEEGGSYMICYGAILFGIVLIARGIKQLTSGREVK